MKPQDKNIIVLIILTAFFPVINIFMAAIGYTFEVENYYVFVIIMTALYGVFIKSFWDFRKEPCTTFLRITALILAILGVINLITYVLVYTDVVVTIVMFLWLVSDLILFLYVIRNTRFKIITWIMCACSVCMLLPFTALCLLFANIGENIVVKTVCSPEENYYAQVINSDQGALGGDTLVQVYDKTKSWNFLLFKIYKSPKTIYMGEWGEFNTMEIEWKNAATLLINEMEYKVF